MRSPDDDTDFELEVTPLLVDERSEPAGASAQRRDTSHRAIGVSTPKTGLSSQRTRWRLAQGAGTVAALLIALALLLRGVDVQSSSGAVAVPTPTLETGADMIAFIDSVPWGRLTIDGQPRPTPAMGAVYRVPRGHHILGYRASPFPSLRCVLSVPAAVSDTCVIHVLTSNEAHVLPAPPARVIDLEAVPSALPSGEQQALSAAVLQVLSQTAPPTVIQPGDHYAGADGETLAAEQPLAAALTYTFFQASDYGAACTPFCAANADDPQYVDENDTWIVYGFLVAQWRYLLPDGQVVLTPNGANGAITPQVSVGFDLLFNPSGAWEVKDFSSVDFRFLCDSALQMLSSEFPEDPIAAADEAIDLVSADPADGCLIGLVPGGGSAPVGYVLYHFGVFVAGDREAQALMPQLPVASAHESAIVQRILSGPADQPNDITS